MKSHFLVAALLLSLLGCTSRQSEQLTQQEKDQLKREVKAACDSIWANWGRLDGEGTVQYMRDSPEFVAFTPDGSRMEFSAFTKMLADITDSATGFTRAVLREDVLVLSRDVVVYGWHGKSETFLKSGVKMTCDPDALTFVFTKVAGQWKVVYAQESATITARMAAKNG